MAGEKKDPAFLFYVTAWLQSEDVRSMTYEQRGVYIELLSFAWLHGSIPADHGKLRSMLGVTPAKFAKLWAVLQPCWTPSEADEQRLVNPRQEDERTERRRKAEEAREKGRLGGQKAAANRQGAKQTPKQSGKQRRSKASSPATSRATTPAVAQAQPSTTSSRGTPLSPPGGGPKPDGLRAEPEPEPRPKPRGDEPTPVADVTSELLQTRYRACTPNQIARRSMIRAEAERLVGAGITVDDVRVLSKMATTKSDGDPGALLAAWLDRNQWRAVLDEQRSKDKEAGLRSRGSPDGDELGSEAKPAASLIESAIPRRANRA